jgi:nicotinamide riboside transporter PnuC
MPKVTYDPEKVQKQKRLIGIVAVTLLLIVAILSIMFGIGIILWIPIVLVIFVVANLLMRRISKTPL